jgi:hypothetical protein
MGSINSNAGTKEKKDWKCRRHNASVVDKELEVDVHFVLDKNY